MKKITAWVISILAIIFSSCSSSPISGTWVANEVGGIKHYLEFKSSGEGVYYFESDITGTSSPAKFSYVFTESISEVLNDKVEFSASSRGGEYSSIIMGGELISGMLKCSALTSGRSYSLTFKKQ